MKISSILRSTRLALVTLVASSTAMHAHPGHDDHDLTWDFRHLAAHPLATIGCFAVVAAIAWLAGRLVRSYRVKRDLSAR